MVDVARVWVHEALLLRRDLVRPEVVRWHRESIVEVWWGRRTRTGAAKVFMGDLSLTLLFINGLKCTVLTRLRSAESKRRAQHLTRFT